MTGVATRIGRALLTGFAWAIAWVPIGMVGDTLIVGELEPEHIGGPLYASVICGATFAFFSGIASGRRRLDELTLTQAATWGAVSGAVVGMLPFILGDQHNPGSRPLWVLPVAVISTLAVLGALSAAASVPFARRAKNNLDAAEGSMASRKP